MLGNILKSQVSTLRCEVTIKASAEIHKIYSIFLNVSKNNRLFMPRNGPKNDGVKFVESARFSPLHFRLNLGMPGYSAKI